MSIRQRFLATILSLVFFGVMAISSFALLFVHDSLLRSSRDNLDRQAQYLATLLVDQGDSTQYEQVMEQFVLYGDYKVELLDEKFVPLLQAGSLGDSSGHIFSGIAPLAGLPTQDRQYVRVVATETEIRATLQKVRTIIYVGIFFTLLFTVRKGCEK